MRALTRVDRVPPAELEDRRLLTRQHLDAVAAMYTDGKVNDPGSVPEQLNNPLSLVGDGLRISVDEVAKRATCDRGKSGCLIVKDKRILCSGYVGSPPGFPHCDEAGHLLKKVINDDGSISRHCVRTIHAEQNAICQAAKYGIPLEGTTLYCTMEPCRVCAMLIISVGVKKVVWM